MSWISPPSNVTNSCSILCFNLCDNEVSLLSIWWGLNVVWDNPHHKSCNFNPGHFVSIIANKHSWDDQYCAVSKGLHENFNLHVPIRPILSWVFIFIFFSRICVSLNFIISSPEFFNENHHDSSETHSKSLKKYTKSDHFSLVGNSRLIITWCKIII